ncbi:hypothetical protein LOD99_362 [Oopsacas minuta]|uniref:Uncharacterized protein n=1 Tax=Oopsacas minuta TaxID=111878 RepID=A0AAV7KC14_9METZ|nr:hypothetical protein LOD99_362 [Oopsacas minuta]
MNQADSQDESMDEWEVNSTDSEDVDLREQFLRGDLKSGHLYRQQLTEETPVDYAKTINNISGIKKSLLNLKRGYPEQWIERMAVNVPLIAVNDSEDKDKHSTEIDIHDDFNRELSFYQQAQKGVINAFGKLKSLGIETERPEDYLAEMLKSESHMQRVREKLVMQEKIEEMREKAKKDRENRKKLKAERKMGKSKLKSRRSGAFIGAGDELVEESRDKKRKFEDDTKSPRKKFPIKGKLDRNATTNKRRDWKDRKFGFGGKSGKTRKRNSAQSSADMSGFKSYKNSKPSVKKTKGNLNKRPGKLRRKQIKIRKGRN